MNTCIICEKQLKPIKNDFDSRKMHKKCEKDARIPCPLCPFFKAYNAFDYMEHTKTDDHMRRLII